MEHSTITLTDADACVFADIYAQLLVWYAPYLNLVINADAPFVAHRQKESRE